MESIRREYQTIIEKNLEANRKSAWETRDWLLHSSVAYHGRCVRTLQIPKVLPHGDCPLSGNLFPSLTPFS